MYWHLQCDWGYRVKVTFHLSMTESNHISLNNTPDAILLSLSTNHSKSIPLAYYAQYGNKYWPHFNTTHLNGIPIYKYANGNSHVYASFCVREQVESIALTWAQFNYTTGGNIWSIGKFESNFGWYTSENPTQDQSSNELFTMSGGNGFDPRSVTVCFKKQDRDSYCYAPIPSNPALTPDAVRSQRWCDQATTPDDVPTSSTSLSSLLTITSSSKSSLEYYSVSATAQATSSSTKNTLASTYSSSSLSVSSTSITPTYSASSTSIPPTYSTSSFLLTTSHSSIVIPTSPPISLSPVIPTSYSMQFTPFIPTALFSTAIPTSSLFPIPTCKRNGSWPETFVYQTAVGLCFRGTFNGMDGQNTTFI